MNSKKIVGVILVIPILGVLASYLAGCLYFFMHDSDLSQVMPFTFIEQWRYYHDDIAYQKSLNIAAMGGAGVAFIAPLLMVMFAHRDIEELHGSARWANHNEVFNLYKLAKNKDDGKGILIGRLGRRFLYYTGNAFVFLAAASRTGKGIGIIIPNLLRWFDSCVVTDFKKENFAITSKFRKEVLKQDVYLFNPFDESGETHRYNPLGYVRNDHLTIPDILTIAEMFYPTDVGDSTAKYFASSAQSLFLGLALYLYQTPELPFTIGEILRQAKGKGKPLNEHLTAIIEERADLSAPCLEAFNDFLALDVEKGQSSVSNTLKAALQDWNNPIFDAATSANDFNFHDLRKKRMTIYIGITPDYIPVSGRILNLFFSQLINLNTKELPEQNRSLKYKVLLLMDEFTAMGRSAIIAKSNNYFAGYGLQLITIVQNPAQIRANEPEGYGQNTATTFIGNHEAQLIYTPEKEDAEEMSKFLGDKTVKVESEQRTTGKSGKTVTVSEQRRALMLPQELREMPFEKMIIMMRGRKAIYGDKIHYYQESPFIDRLKALSPSLGQIKGIPTKAQLDDAIAAKELQITIESVAQEIVEPIPVFASPLENLPSDYTPTQSKPEPSIADEQALALLSESHYEDNDLPDF
ncbi:type IV secretory system conjugative DNA transfer family protein [Vibrio parahaemolyticus]|uniref:type IV secretory system conjugative DNA transfer family protein n=1 Tax=Vibrio parahaemolyticus TaxID=670 RepID=UPI0007B6BE7A|nr:type IV secretory system conjugative DNA transfer family protein [Vibrio parahaemolyticus]ANC00460.1 Conjugal transfer protein TraG [Vibrio parahaemolyticus]ELA7420699.1 type IV secretory system conjugative DNA transfer family protein [Vibrio parahaemolyticus]MBE5164914.1 type IV secretory system conjugative DNA transfer family protein [Vibrio parahaemolyticus]